MRDFAKVAPSFWIGDTGRALRQLGAEAQVAALYLITAPGANMIGLYYLPLPTFCHETGLTAEGASKALRSLSEGEFAHYDPPSETVWVPEMARYQLGDDLSPKDNRHKAVLRELEAHRKCRFYEDFRAKYKDRFNLPEPSPFEVPSKPLRSKEKEKEKEKTPSASGPSSAEPPTGPPPVLVFRCTGGGPPEWPLTPAKLAEYEESFPTLDVLAALRAARQWTIDNQPKTFRGTPAFCTNWLNRCVKGNQNLRPPPAVRGGDDLAAAKRRAEEALQNARRLEGGGPDA
jgi:hypothetical protein